MSKPRALVSWSSGKDSAWTLHVLWQRAEYDVVGLVTTVNRAFGRVAMHAVPVALLEAQAEAVGLPLWTVEIPHPCANAQYEAAMSRFVAQAQSQGVAAVAFGDLFLEDVRRYRETRLAGAQIKPEFPLWRRQTRSLAETMVRSGMRAVLTCVDPKKLPASFAGREFDRELLRDLPAGVDPCGENGEFHTFVYGGPMLRRVIPITVGEVTERDGFVFADVRRAVRDRGSEADPAE